MMHGLRGKKYGSFSRFADAGCTGENFMGIWRNFPGHFGAYSVTRAQPPPVSFPPSIALRAENPRHYVLIKKADCCKLTQINTSAR
jgi:hypothetical protein